MSGRPASRGAVAGDAIRPVKDAGSQNPALARADFDFIRYGSVWEDADVLCAALEPVAPGRRLLSIASAGDNVLALLTLNPGEVVAVDVSKAQLACVELRMLAFRTLEYDALLRFLGVFHAPDRRDIYGRLKKELTPQARAFWDARPDVVARGVIHSGKFEAYFALFRRWILPLVHSGRTVAELLQLENPAEQAEFYRRRWDTWRWRLLFRLFFSRFVMGRLGRAPEFFAHVEGPVARRILERSRHALVDMPLATNPYLRYIVTGNYAKQALPLYLRPAHFDTIRARLDRVRLVCGPIDVAPSGSFAGLNLSDIFEYMSPDEHDRCYARLVDHAEDGARLVYWNLLAARGRPAALASDVRPLTSLATQLHERDRAWFYSRLHVDEVVKEGGR